MFIKMGRFNSKYFSSNRSTYKHYLLKGICRWDVLVDLSYLMISNLFEVEAVLDRIRLPLDLISLIFGNIFNHTSGNRTLNKKAFIKLEL